MSDRVLWNGERDKELLFAAQDRLSILVCALENYIEGTGDPESGCVYGHSQDQENFLSICRDFCEKFGISGLNIGELLQAVEYPPNDLYHLSPRMNGAGLFELVAASQKVIESFIAGLVCYWLQTKKLEFAAVQYELGAGVCEGTSIISRDESH